MIAGCSEWEMWLHYSGDEGRPEGEPLHLEVVSRRDEGAFGALVERSSLLGYRDIIGETNYPINAVWRGFGQ